MLVEAQDVADVVEVVLVVVVVQEVVVVAAAEQARLDSALLLGWPLFVLIFTALCSVVY